MKLSRTRFNKLSLASALVCAGLSALAGTATAADNNWNPEHILNVLKNPYQSLPPPPSGGTSHGNVVTISHRGLIDDGCPENSNCAILNAYHSSVEALELDVKQSKDGTPWLFHDLNAGRVLDHPGDNFNIFTGKGWNADVRTLGDTTIGSAYLRDHSFKSTKYHPITVEEALETVKNSANHMVIELDLKSLDAVSRSADIAIKKGMQNQVVLKFNASQLPDSPGKIESYTKGVAFVPAIYAGDMDNIVDSGYLGTCSSSEGKLCRVEAWINAAAKNKNYAWVEIGNKEPKPGDPTYLLLTDLAKGKKALGAFSPVPEYQLNSTDGAHYVRSDGTCCAKLSDYLSKSKYFGNESQDLRENVPLQLSSDFTNVISDSPSEVNNAAGKINARHTSLYN